MGFINIGIASNRAKCKNCGEKIPKDSRTITAISSVFYGHENWGYMCRNCFLDLVHGLEPDILKKSVRDKIEQMRVAKRV